MLILLIFGRLDLFLWKDLILMEKMEVDGGGGGSGGSAGDVVEVGGEGGGGGGVGCSEMEKNNTPEGGETKVKRKMKTASQLEILEKAYAG